MTDNYLEYKKYIEKLADVIESRAQMVRSVAIDIADAIYDAGYVLPEKKENSNGTAKTTQ